jgi:hypothetical protein
MTWAMQPRAVETFHDGLVVFSSGVVAMQVEPNLRHAFVAIGMVARYFGRDDDAYVASAAAGSSIPPSV